MRRIGQISDPVEAERLRDYLIHRGLGVQLISGGSGWDLWLQDEDRLAEARQEYEQFQASPSASHFVAGAAEYRRDQAQRLHAALQARREEIEERRAPAAAPIRSVPVTFAVIVLCGVATAAVRFGADEQMLDRLLLSQWQPRHWTTLGLPEIRSGEVWRLITPCFVHFDALHLLGNASWMYLFGRVIEQTRTRGRFTLLLLILGIGSNLAQYIVAGPAFGGLSGVNCGLFGYLWFKTHFRPEAGFELAPEHTILFAGWMVICLTGLAGPVANTAHVSGMLLGMVLALPRSVPVFR
jgi:GlpG protein